MAAPVLVEVTRGPAVASSPRGQVVASGAQGNPHRWVGDREAPVCLRSLAKPFQAPAVLTSGAAALGLAAPELALFSGSLSGQDFQTALVTATLARLGLTPAARESLARYRQPAILNHRREAVGLLRPVCRLEKSP